MAANLADLGPRAASAAVMAVLALGSAYVGGHLFALFWLVAAVAILWEWRRMSAPGEGKAGFIAGAATLAAASGLAIMVIPEAAIGVLLAGCALTAFLTREPSRRAWTASGLAYAGALVISTMTLRGSVLQGFAAILWLFAVVWTTDVMAYFSGRSIGGPKLWPAVSPSKTWAGFIGGVSCGALAGLAVAPRGSDGFAVLLLGLVAAAFSQGGDLLESSIKRRFGAKDSSNLIPGHGGFMDRLDGFVAAAALAALVGVAHRGPAEAASGLFWWWGAPT